MKLQTLILSVAVAVVTVACGQGMPAAESVDQPSPTTAIPSENEAEAQTLGITPEAFAARWNSFLHVHDFLQIEATDIDGPEPSIHFADDWTLELTTDPASGEVTQAEIRSSLDAHTDQIIMRWVSWLSVVQAANPEITIDLTEDISWVTDPIGMPNLDSDTPTGIDDEEYSSEGEIEGVLYTFEKSRFDVALTAEPAP